jgi:hypothetical protein
MSIMNCTTSFPSGHGLRSADRYLAYLYDGRAGPPLTFAVDHFTFFDVRLSTHVVSGTFP